VFFMICFLEGTIEYYGTGFLLLRCDNVGYRIIVPNEVGQSFSGQTSVYIHEVIRDDQREFFGFKEMSDLELFWKLIGISGVGPRGAQKIVYTGGANAVRQAIMKGDLAFFVKVPGVGKKTAQKIILELTGVLKDSVEDGSVGIDTEALDALVGLGFPKKEAEKALAAVEADSTDDRIRLVLKGTAL